TYAHEQGRQQIKQLDFVEKTIAIENISTKEDAMRVISELADDGYKLIFAASYEHYDAVIESATKYPDITFMQCRDSGRAFNVGSFLGKMQEATYLAGVSVGMLTKTNKIGIVASEPIPEVIWHINGYALGIKSTNPNAKLYVKWTNSWNDPKKETEYIKEFKKMGCDIILHNTDSSTTQIEAESQGLLSVGYSNDMSKLAPNSQITAAIWNWYVVYKYVAEQVYNKTWDNEPIFWGIKEGLVDLAPFNNSVPKEVKDEVEKRKYELKNDLRNPFSGPIYDNNGNLRVNEGKVINDYELLIIDWFADNVIDGL
ncbi:MAG TPA: BMP family ABC transporter substrate-binding protein, partial [Candidatus Cloacimonadota bacterium]|nr:BMP family ABC transporter substrate-binding protein [Candidatus Cloacimonadota bacterium]